MVLDHEAAFVHGTESSVACFCLLRVFTGRRLSNAMLTTLDEVGVWRIASLFDLPIKSVVFGH